MEPTDRSDQCIPTFSARYPPPGQTTYAGRPTGGGATTNRHDAGHRSQHHWRCGDTWAMRARLTSNHFVGRAGELAELELALGEAAGRQPGLRIQMGMPLFAGSAKAGWMAFEGA